MANEGAGCQVEAIDSAGVGVVADQQSVAERAEVRRGNGESPGLVERRARDEGLHEGTIFLKDVNVSTGCAICSGESDIELAANILNAAGGKASGEARVGEGSDEVEGAVVNVDLIVSEIGGVEKVAGSLAGNRQAGGGGGGNGVIHADQFVVGREVRPAADGAVQSREQECRCPVHNLEF